MKIAVGSLNPVKIEAVKLAFELIWPEKQIIVEGISVGSGVPDQPMSDKESIKGARSRARKALQKLHADFGIGLEGGLHKIGKTWFDCGWVVVVNNGGLEGIGSTARLVIPAKIMKHIKNGKELGQVSDMLFKRENVKQAEGYFGLMTNNLLNRRESLKSGVLCALSRFMVPWIFER